MERLEGTQARPGGAAAVTWRVDYEVVGRVIHFKARFDGSGSHEGEFEFDPQHLDAAEAMRAFMHDHIAKSDRDVAP